MKKLSSIITDNAEECYFCGSHNWIEIHHIFGAANRSKSTMYGLVVPLCRWCHNEPPNGVHHNKALRLHLQTIAQKKAMERYDWTEDDFRKIFGKNYL